MEDTPFTQFSQVLESLSSGLLVLQTTSRVLFLNREAERILGTPRGDLLGRTLVSLPRFRSLAGAINQYRRQTPSLVRSRRQYEGTVVRPDGEIVSIGFSISTLHDREENVRGYVVVFRDLEDVMRLRERSGRGRALAALGSMAAGIAHEVRNPLHAVRGALEMLAVAMEAGTDPRAYVEVIHKEVERIERTVEDVLEYSRTGALKFRECDLSACVQAALRRVEVPEDVDLAYEQVGTPVRIAADPKMLERIVINLVQNSLDALEGSSGTVLVKVGLERSGDDPPGGGSTHAGGDWALIEVQDSGSGISSEDLPHVFEPFFSKKAARGGTGLGLAIAQRIVQDHGGAILADSAPGVGTVFKVLLPTEMGTDE